MTEQENNERLATIRDNPAWLHGEPPPPPRPPQHRSGGTVIGGILLLLFILGCIGTYVKNHQEAVVTTCPPLSQVCYQSTYPIESGAP